MHHAPLTSDIEGTGTNMIYYDESAGKPPEDYYCCVQQCSFSPNIVAQVNDSACFTCITKREVEATVAMFIIVSSPKH